MARKHRAPSRQRYDDAHPTVGVHFDRATYDRIQVMCAESGLSVAYLVKRSLGVVEKEVTKATTTGFNNGRRSGLAEGRRLGMKEGRELGHTDGWSAGFTAGEEAADAASRQVGYEEAEGLYKIEFPCASCRSLAAIKKGSPEAGIAVMAMELNHLGHPACVAR